MLASEAMNITQSLEWLESFCGAFGPDDGVPDADLDRAARRLELELPRALRDYYRKAGRATVLTGRFVRLLPPKQFRLDDGHLIYVRDRRGDVHWGVPVSELGREDPSLELGYRSEAGGAWRYAPDFPSVSVAARAMGAWEAVQGGLPFVGVVRLSPSKAVFREPPSDRLGIELKAMRAWQVPNGVVVASGGQVYLAARSAEAYRSAGAFIGIGDDQWDYATIIDGD